jgi:UDP-glucuronate 4-epimerase
MALYDFTNKIVRGQPIQLYNYGFMVRDFTYVSDIVQAIKILIKAPLDDHEIYNIGYGQRVPIMEFVRAIEKSLGREAVIELVEGPPGDVPETWADTRKVQALGYKPEVSIQEGVEKFVSWYKTYHKVN